jgi:hypothetical protein
LPPHSATRQVGVDFLSSTFNIMGSVRRLSLARSSDYLPSG